MKKSTWLKKHKIKTHKSRWVASGQEPWMCWSGELNPFATQATGETELHALETWAAMNKVKLWNEK